MSDEQPAATAAEETFAARLVDDLSRILGTGILIEEMDLRDEAEDDDVQGGGSARIRVQCLFDGGIEMLEAEGATNAEAYQRLVGAGGGDATRDRVEEDDRRRSDLALSQARRSAAPRLPLGAT